MEQFHMKVIYSMMINPGWVTLGRAKFTHATITSRPLTQSPRQFALNVRQDRWAPNMALTSPTRQFPLPHREIEDEMK